MLFGDVGNLITDLELKTKYMKDFIMKNIKNLLALAVFLFGGYVMAADHAVPAVDVVAPEQTSVQDGSGKVAELEALVQKVLEAQKPSMAKRAGFVALKEVAKLAGYWRINVRYHLHSNNERQCLCLLLLTMMDRFIRGNDSVLKELNELEESISLLTNEEKEKFAPIFNERYAGELSNKVENEKDGVLVGGGDFAGFLADFLLISVFAGLPVYPKNFIDTILKDVRSILGAGNKMPERIDINANLGDDNFYMFSKKARIKIAAKLALFAFGLYQLGSNLYYNPSSEKSRALARIQKALNK